MTRETDGHTQMGQTEMLVILGWAVQICLSYSEGMVRSEVKVGGAGQILDHTRQDGLSFLPGLVWHQICPAPLTLTSDLAIPSEYDKQIWPAHPNMTSISGRPVPVWPVNLATLLRVWPQFIQSDWGKMHFLTMFWTKSIFLSPIRPQWCQFVRWLKYWKSLYPPFNTPLYCDLTVFF